MTALSADDLHKAFGGVAAVAGVSFALGAGEQLALIGPNGAGKSTIFNMLGGQIRPDRGVIRLGETDITGVSPRAIVRLGVGRTFQITTTFRSMTTVENMQVAIAAAARQNWRPFGKATRRHRAEALALLGRVGIADLAGRHAATLAYGDLKRLELALALAGHPRVLLMDEPTAGMAAAERGQLMRLVSEIVRADAVSVLFTEHDMDVVFGHADRIVVLARGAIVAQGSPAAIRGDARVQAVYLGGGDMAGRLPAGGDGLRARG